MDLGKEYDINRIDVYQDPRYSAILEIYVPATFLQWIIDESLVEWKRIGVVSSNISRVKTNVKVRFIKLVFSRTFEKIRIGQIIINVL